MKVQHTIAILVLLLLVRFLASYFMYEIPLGYDPGIYRYLFFQYEQALGSFSLPDLLPWATEHPPGLFILGAIIMKMGIPIDVLIGWLWNIIPPLLAVTLAWVISERKGMTIGVCVMLFALISPAFYDGFFAMYYKVYVALIFVCLTYHFAEQLSPWFLLTAFLTVVIHHQTGFVMTVALGFWWCFQVPTRWSDPMFRRYTLGLASVGLLGLLVYLPHFERMFWTPFKSIFLLRGDDAPAGAFPEASFYFGTMAIVLGFGFLGFWQNVKEEKNSLWQLSVIICVAFVFFRLVFYKRFFLHLDFFLMPFAAQGLVFLWEKSSSHFHHAMIMIVLGAQVAISYQAMMLREPRISLSEFRTIETLHTLIDDSSAVITLDNVSAPWVLGWMPNHLVGAPGLFDYPDGTLEEWATFILGNNAERKVLLETIDEDMYIYASPVFKRHYQEYADIVLADPCLERLGDSPLYHSLCPAP